LLLSITEFYEKKGNPRNRRNVSRSAFGQRRETKRREEMKTTGNVFIAEGRERERENPLSFFGVTFHTTNCDVSTA
jgi:hypothetical protein